MHWIRQAEPPRGILCAWGGSESLLVVREERIDRFPVVEGHTCLTVEVAERIESGYTLQAGRSTQPDPIGLAGGLNLYGYAGGDPVNRHDPFGLFDVEVQGENSRMIVAYLLEHSATFRDAYNRLNNDRSVRLTIRDANDPQRAGVGASGFFCSGANACTIRFNDISLNQANATLFSRNPASSFMYTAASVMGHEMGHAAGHWSKTTGVPTSCGLLHPASNACSVAFENKVRSDLPTNAQGGWRTRYDP